MEGEKSHRSGRRIKLLNPLGKGGFGAVYLADVTTRDGLVQRLAVKLLHESWAHDSGIAARARDEARLMSQLNHDNVLKIYGLTRVSDRAAVLMEYVEGIDCRTMVVATAKAAGVVQGLPSRVAVSIIERAASALAAAWSDISPQTGQPLRVVHRDIKPSNLLVSINGAVKVMDFGVARADFEREALTGSVQFGTHRYMAPERWLKGEAGHASDLFSLGVTFWELLTGVRFERLPLDPVVYAEGCEVQLERLKTLELSEEVCSELTVLLREMLDYDEETRIDAIGVEERLGALEGLLTGAGLRRYARQVLPPLVRNQLQTLKSDPDLLDMTGTLLIEDTPKSNSEPADDIIEAPSEATGPMRPMFSAAPATTPLPGLSADLPTPSSKPTDRFTPAPVIRPPVQLPDPLSVSVSVPTSLAHRRRKTPLLVAALAVMLLSAGGVTAWNSGEVSTDEAPPRIVSVVAEVEQPVVEEAAAEVEPEPVEEIEEVAVVEPPVVAPPAQQSVQSVQSVARPEPAVATSSLAPTQEPEIDRSADAALTVAIGEDADELSEEESPDVRVIRVTEAAPPPSVSFKLIASPREGSFSLNGAAFGIGSVTLPEGSYTLFYAGPDWQRSCTVQIYAGLSRIKVDKEVPGCQAS